MISNNNENKHRGKKTHKYHINRKLSMVRKNTAIRKKLVNGRERRAVKKMLTITLEMLTINPLLPIAHKSARIGKISILKLEGIIKKISYERSDYESVHGKKTILGYVSQKLRKKGTKGLMKIMKSSVNCFTMTDSSI